MAIKHLWEDPELQPDNIRENILLQQRNKDPFPSSVWSDPGASDETVPKSYNEYVPDEPASVSPSPVSPTANTAQLQPLRAVPEGGADVGDYVKGIASTAVTGASAAGVWGAVAGAVVGAATTWWGSAKQEQARKEAIEYNEKISSHNEAIEEGRHKEELSAYNVGKINKTISDLNSIKFREDDEEWRRKTEMANRILGMINSHDSLRSAVFGRGQAAQRAQGPAYDFRALNPIGR